MNVAQELLRVAKLLVSIEFDTQDAYDKYMKKHPKADPKNHSVKQNNSAKGKTFEEWDADRQKKVEEIKKNIKEMSLEKIQKERKEAGTHISKSLSNTSRISEEQKKEYQKAADQVLDYMSGTALVRFNSNVRDVAFYSSPTQLISSVLDMTEEDVQKNHYNCAGVWQSSREEAKGLLHLDGGMKGETQDFPARDIYAHEFAHAIDAIPDELRKPDQRAGLRISHTSEWNEAWQKEIKDTNGLTAYASTKPTEGFAEFGRLVFTQPTYAREIYPKCWNVWHDHGLVSGKRGEV